MVIFFVCIKKPQNLISFSVIILCLLCFHTEYLIIILQHAAELEQKQNESENKKLLGEIVKYSNVIQVSIYLLSFKRGEYFIGNLHMVGMPSSIKILGYNSLLFGRNYRYCDIFS